ncbi:YihY/virulence factor BrkB family protein [Parageobacillus thermoglucosidasius]|uniref:YihY/virulence factor BrkB family protein n=1 Tax=Parageobacillus thermoglucosidasius TaxID=1426 RepID=UPI0001D17F68|nr:YihY/virulence factor BrkB family protein [Parageobacillus thermoglucosidasius]REK54375.1 MAG: YihY/virulence factor BrkB family protein [Geobacillus sp.]AEH49303.1 ribonuclease BN [Parageobacillus thermoglucosidasius C56-YS93]MBY6270135.1 YihY/virulence factor BrkB family protein [Parageobacillus thermoglucosidasius]MED4906513.1 YihY/virulence factor BrkB family protein [Parageobacillus thermoglucosidasius]MED4915851.1 YihY/virulence factor BrkB family protein [Parageobacillus thermoglucos
MMIDLTFIREMARRFQEDEIPRLSAELAYYFLLSLFPFLIFLITLLAYLPIPHEDLLSVIRQYAPKEAIHLVEANVHRVMDEQNGRLLSLSIIGAIWSASNGMNAIVRAFNRAYDVVENRPFLVARGMSVLLTLGMIVVIIVALVLPVFGKMIGLFLFSAFGFSATFLTIWNAMRWVISSLILFAVFTALYYFAPNKKLRCANVVRGAIFATIGWIITSLAFSYYVNHFAHYAAMYGSLGGMIILMVWFYLSGMIIVLGGEMNAIFDCEREGRKR